MAKTTREGLAAKSRSYARERTHTTRNAWKTLLLHVPIVLPRLTTANVVARTIRDRRNASSHGPARSRRTTTTTLSASRRLGYEARECTTELLNTVVFLLSGWAKSDAAPSSSQQMLVINNDTCATRHSGQQMTTPKQSGKDRDPYDPNTLRCTAPWNKTRPVYIRCQFLFVLQGNALKDACHSAAGMTTERRDSVHS